MQCLERWCSHLTDAASRARTYKTNRILFPWGTAHPPFPWKCSQTCGYRFFSWQQQYVSFSRLAQRRLECVIPTSYFFFLSSRALALTTNWHPVSYPGVHAEARPVPAEHISGPVPAVTPQEGPRAAQVHRGRNVRAVSNPNNKKDYSMATDYTHTHTPRTTEQLQKKKKI